MKKLLSLFALTACLVLANVLPASARNSIYLSPEELWKRADFVVIATVNSSKDTSTIVNPDAEAPISVTTKFDVQVVLKGDIEKKTEADKISVSVLHDRFSDDKKNFLINGPVYIKFDQKPVTRYLMFLEGKSKDNLRPLTGQWDPENSIYRVEDFFPIREVGAPARINPPDEKK